MDDSLPITRPDPAAEPAAGTSCFKRLFLIGLLCFTLLGTLAGTAACQMVSYKNKPTATTPPAGMPERLQECVQTLCNTPRYGETRHVAERYIMARLRADGWEVGRQAFTVEGGTYHNITAVRKGTGAKRYIIGAHYDACDTGDNPGADDNASAVAALLEIAHRLPRTTPEYTVELVFYACEEPPWFGTEDMGSARHAAACNPADVEGMICLEMLGYYSDEPGSQPPLFPGAGLLLPTVGDFIAVVGDTSAVKLAKQAQSALAETMPALRVNAPFTHGTALYFSDHRNYQPLGIPAIMVTDTAMLRNPNYHEPTDTPDTLDYRRMARVTSALIQLVRKLAW